MAISHNLGFPRIGEKRELKRALEQYWRGEQSAEALEQTATQLRKRHWLAQRDAGIDLIPVGDFSFYDHMLDMSALLGTLPPRFGAAEEELSLERYFAMARGTAEQPALEMTKWFDTNYHYLVPELSLDTEFSIGSTRLFTQIAEAQALGLRIKPVLVGPLTYLYLSKTRGTDFNRLHLLQRLLPAYQSILQRIAATGVEWVQLDEPALALDLPDDWLAALDRCYAELAMPDGEASCKILLATYFGDVSEHCARLKALPVAGLHLDLCRAPQQLQKFLPRYPRDKVLSLGVVDGRNIWRADLEQIYGELQHAQEYLTERLWVAPSCSLLHAPIDLRHENKFDPELRGWLAFGLQKLEEVALLSKGLNEGRASIAAALQASSAARETRRTSARIHDAKVQQRVQALSAADSARRSAFLERQPVQRKRFALPPFPTTSIGSFPQTAEIRGLRAAYKHGDLAQPDYVAAMQAEIRLAIEKQEALGLDVLVHGEAERNDMVEYFGEQLSGFAFSENGWVQSYGSRCVKPPIIYGDVSRPHAMTVEWFRYAQSLSSKPVKGMLTGPVTILQWSFVRDDQPREQTAKQIALAIRDEVCDLERAGAGMVQIDEPAFREGLPLKRAQWDEYLAWAAEAFRISASGVRDDTQIHTHMCYSEFNDILPSIAALDADVITIETSRSDMELLGAFGDFKYPNEIGPGVYDIHSPRVPDYVEMLRLLRKACTVVDPHNLWVNPDCGLKTRGWPETEAALHNMVKAARQLRHEYAA